MTASHTVAELDCESTRENLLPLLSDIQRTVSNADLQRLEGLAEEAADMLLLLAEACEALQPELEKSRPLLRPEPELLGRELRHMRNDLQRIGRHATEPVEPGDLEESLARWLRTFEAWDRSFSELLRSVRESHASQDVRLR